MNKSDIFTDNGDSKQQLSYQRMKDDILNNVYPAGSVLSERKLCEIYNVSRSPIRNAIQQLSHEGLLSYVPGKGVIVNDFSIEDILEVYDLIEVLQVYALHSISRRIDDYFLNFLHTSLEKMKGYIDDGNIKKAGKWDHQFHQFLITSSSNRRLAQIYEQLSVQSMRFISTTANDAELAMRSYREHLDVYECLKNQDLKGAEEKLRLHYKNTKQYYVDKLIDRIHI